MADVRTRWQKLDADTKQLVSVAAGLWALARRLFPDSRGGSDG